MDTVHGRIGWVLGGLLLLGCGKSIRGESDATTPSMPPSTEPLNVACTQADFTDPHAAVAAGFAGDALVYLLADGSEKIVDRDPAFADVTDAYWSVGKSSVAIAYEGARLYDRSGALVAYQPEATRLLPIIHADGSASVDLSTHDLAPPEPTPAVLDGLLLRTDGTVLELPYFKAEPDEHGWVLADSIDGIDVTGTLVNPSTGEIVRPTDEPYIYSKPAHLGSRFFYVAQTNGGAVLVDQELERINRVNLGAWPEGEIPNVYLSKSKDFVFVTVRDVPTWRYGLAERTARPIAPVASDARYLDGYRATPPDDFLLMTVEGSVGRVPSWWFDPVSGRVGDASTLPGSADGRLDVISTAASALVVEGGIPRWHVDRVAGNVRALELGDVPRVDAVTLEVEGTAVVVSDGLPQRTIDLGSAETRALDTRGLAHASDAMSGAGFAVGIAEGTPVWLLRADTGITNALPPLPEGFTAAPWPAPTVRADGTVAIVALEGTYAAHWLVLEPRGTWTKVGTPVTDVRELNGRALRFGWVLNATNNTYVTLSQNWSEPPPSFGATLPGDSEQLVAFDGSVAYEALFEPYWENPAPHEIAVDPSESCALGDGTALVDLATGVRRDIPEIRNLKWFAR